MRKCSDFTQECSGQSLPTHFKEVSPSRSGQEHLRHRCFCSAGNSHSLLTLIQELRTRFPRATRGAAILLTESQGLRATRRGASGAWQRCHSQKPFIKLKISGICLLLSPSWDWRQQTVKVSSQSRHLLPVDFLTPYLDNDNGDDRGFYLTALFLRIERHKIH